MLEKELKPGFEEIINSEVSLHDKLLLFSERFKQEVEEEPTSFDWPARMYFEDIVENQESLDRIAHVQNVLSQGMIYIPRNMENMISFDSIDKVEGIPHATAYFNPDLRELVESDPLVHALKQYKGITEYYNKLREIQNEISVAERKKIRLWTGIQRADLKLKEEFTTNEKDTRIVRGEYKKWEKEQNRLLQERAENKEKHGEISEKIELQERMLYGDRIEERLKSIFHNTKEIEFEDVDLLNLKIRKDLRNEMYQSLTFIPEPKKEKPNRKLQLVGSVVLIGMMGLGLWGMYEKDCKKEKPNYISEKKHTENFQNVVSRDLEKNVSFEFKIQHKNQRNLEGQVLDTLHHGKLLYNETDWEKGHIFFNEGDEEVAFGFTTKGAGNLALEKRIPEGDQTYYWLKVITFEKRHLLSDSKDYSVLEFKPAFVDTLNKYFSDIIVTIDGRDDKYKPTDMILFETGRIMEKNKEPYNLRISGKIKEELRPIEIPPGYLHNDYNIKKMFKRQFPIE